MKKLKTTLKITALLLVMFMTVQCNQSTLQESVEDDNDFSFVFVTDVHVQPEFNAGEGLKQAIDTINSINPDFVLTGGDNIRDALREQQGRADSLYNLFDEITESLNMPLYSTIGNHEVFGLYEQSNVSPADDLYGKKMYEEKVGDLYYSFDHKDWHFIVLDGIGFTEDRHYYGVVDSVQMDWLKADLESSKGKPVAVSIHIPILSAGQQIMGEPTSAFYPSEIITNAKEVMALLEQYNVKMVLQGHLHILEDVYYNGIHYITGGAVSAQWWQGKRFGMDEGFLKIDVSGEDFKWEYIDYGWEPENNQLTNN